MNKKGIKVDLTCRECKKTETIQVNEVKFFHWRQGALIQNVFPELSVETREFMTTGYCPACQEKIYSCLEEAQ